MFQGQRYGKLFYVMIAMMIVCAIIPAVFSVIVVSYQSEQSSSYIKSLVESVLSSGIGQYGNVYPSESSTQEIYELLNGDGLLDDVALQGYADDGDLAEIVARLAEHEATLEAYAGVDHTLSLYFIDAGLLISVDDASAGAFTEDDLAVIVSRDVAVGETMAYLHTDGSLRTTLVNAVSEGVYLLTTKSEADVLEEALVTLGSLEGVQVVAQYDGYDNVRIVLGEDGVASSFSLADFSEVDEVATVSFNFDGQDYFCSYISYEHSNMALAVFVLDRSAVAARNARILSAIIVCFACVAGCVFFVVFRRQVYVPVRRIASSVESDAEGEFDELRSIESGVAQLKSRDSVQSALLRDAALLHLLQGRNGLAEEGGVSGFPFDEGGTCVVVGVKAESDGGSGVLSDSAIAIVRAKLDAAGFHKAVVVDDGLLAVFVVAVEEAATDDQPCGAIVAACERAKASSEFIEQGCTLSFFVSERVATSDGLKEGYDQVNALAEHTLAMERLDTVLRYADFERRIRRTEGLDSKTMRELLDAAQALSVPRVAACFDDIVEGMGLSAGDVVSKDDQTLTAMVGVVRLGISCCSAAHAADFDWEARLDVALAQATSLTGLREALLSTMRDIEEANERDSADKNRFVQVEAFVRENIADENLSGQMVAARFGMSQSNVTRMFKKFTGDGFLAYVHALRVKNAEDVLSQSDLPLEEVARQVGFGNVATMGRAFKKATGMTPYAYREASRRHRTD